MPIVGCSRDANPADGDGVTQTVTVVTKANVQPSQLTHSTKKESDGVTVVTQKSLPLLTAAQQLTASSASTSPGSRDTRKHLRLPLRPSGAVSLDAAVVRPISQARALDDATADHNADATTVQPTEQQRAQWRKASSRRRRREDAGERFYGLSLPEMLVASALTAIRPDLRDRLTDHVLCVQLLRPLVEEALLRVIHDVTDPVLRVDFQFMLKDLARQPRHYRDQRHGSAASRGYGNKWTGAATEFKRLHPWCLGCMAVGVRKATDLVDHIVPHKGDMKLFWNRRNWQPACTWHHNAIKPMVEAKFECGEVGIEALRFDSAASIRLTKAKQIKQMGVDGWLAS